MRSKATEGTLEELLAGVGEAEQAIVRAACALVRAVDPKTTEIVRLGDRAVSFGIGPKKMTEGYAYVMPMKGYVNLGFYQGAQLADPKGQLEGTGKGLRHVKLRAVVDVAACRPLVEAAVRERRGSSRST
ncbi:MAG: DUF1801 domain-containing protein [Polyangiaceae bacterium]|nr:DUF1801 domain-containing protein [Polyangiaceae bacterium]